jgi:hypothetical protein
MLLRNFLFLTLILLKIIRKNNVKQNNILCLANLFEVLDGTIDGEKIDLTRL